MHSLPGLQSQLVNLLTPHLDTIKKQEITPVKVVGSLCALYLCNHLIVKFTRRRDEKIGAGHRIKVDADGTVHNWFGNVKWKPAKIGAPTSLEELRQLVVEAKRNNLTVRAIGSLHSWSASAAIPGGVMLRLEGLNRVLFCDKEAKLIKAEAGIRLDKLYEALDLHQLALDVLPNTDKLTLGGILANAAHGTNIRVGTICSLVTELELLLADGSMLILRADAAPGSVERERFEAAVCSVGHVGVVYAVTLRCVPAYNVVVHEKMIRLDPSMDYIETLLATHESLNLFVSPPQGICLAKVQHRIDRRISSAVRRDWLVDFIVECWVYSYKPGPKKFFKALVGRFAHFATTFSPAVHALIADSIKVLTWQDGEIMVKSFKDRAFLNCEYSVPLHNINQACRMINEQYKVFKAKGYNRHTGWVLRPTGGDPHGFLSPTKGDTPRVYIDMPYQQMDDIEFEFFRVIEAELVKLGGRVSWARRNNLPFSEATRNYEELERFKAVVRELDPTNVFTNPMRMSMLGF
eukprot:c9461_g1_i1.p1 GENE.c9461_g1_i1~~c9461_g1_i1.p1  ORF type:complete len:534 (+),score=119.90 c9461_g1_i1:44-1603(+)